MSRPFEQLVRDISASAYLIHKYVVGLNEYGFEHSQQVQDAVTFRLTVIGEAAGDIIDRCRSDLDHASSVAATADYDMPMTLKLFRRMRDKLIHSHWTIDHTILWNTAQEDVPKLNRELMRSLQHQL
ncbi:HepT-like ribonuclease domain-containing protein [Ralstonia pseudosolanacearum]|uniref:DUF86 domain-containing protein n=1 Tax=Ralstonia solanacearum TaxID=305 RepID=A0A0S4UA10_RALSL|nr:MULTISPECIES: HepT-like ribonuclease domain-containing protein [Ralstonia]APF87813.1 hypothetical protein BCR16_13880 [Ralstonia solanacearum FJAT-1458]ARS55436.1 hypothetical protein BC427_04505 [Ralstonia solanacearum FJAT-91]AVV67839.1 DUF86 domain-containing protein [Ralstonia solanacearum OE1-1]AXV96457.1 DUF86 domain-containing protein [Ralstonia solanacearum]API75441.1 hypothetical protein AC251_13280 [Ralstonia pseudosolanacearum]